MNKTNRSVLDLFKVGVFLLGISAIVISSIALHWYLKVYSQGPYKPPEFYAYCQDKTIVVNANKDLTNVEVLDNQSRVVCELPKISANSDELCPINETGVYQVRHGDSKKIVSCREEIIYIPEKEVD